ncbi:MAG: aldehyde dehydrogenase family protein [Spirochaetales bacterium]|uniref:Aldehyde dehydrogenase family protein n=1 Tax=Candidatus Thalassospirochaeta sargassi TaxID=3119039 RepID=A0AAJ1MJE8_9SPIO|nr:aldehyde dehydrogenase family protein [Spirochaetales bacterium]
MKKLIHKTDNKSVYSMFINGSWDYDPGRPIVEVINPADETITGWVQKADKNTAEKALAAAAAAQPAWQTVPPRERAEIMYRFADLIIADKKRLAAMITAEQGKLLRTAEDEVEGTASFIRFAAEGARRIEGDIFPSDRHDEEILIEKIPYGVTVGITAWNFPLALAGRKIGPALVAGNAMVVKPPLETPLSTLMLGEYAQKAGIPAGILSIVTGSGSELGDALVRSRLTKLVTMTGSTFAGKQIAAAAAENFTAVRLELGGKAPFIVFPDADIDRAARDASVARFQNCGQICVCNERMYIHEDIYDEFMKKFMKHVGSIKVGSPVDPDIDMGPKISRKELENIQRLVDLSIKEGAEIAAGGSPPEGEEFSKGFWFKPTVLTNVRQDMTVVHGESFGPVLPVLKFRDFDEVIKMANDCDYALSAYVYTYDLRRIMRLKNELEFGEIYINHETGEQHQGFHNGYKLSGTGGEDGKYGFENYMQKKTFYLNWE